MSETQGKPGPHQPVSEPQLHPVPSDSTEKRTSCLQLLRNSLALYGQHWQVMTRPLLWPLVQISAGAYGCLILCYLFINAMATTYRAFLEQHLFWVLGILLGICLLTLRIFCKGFWEYLLCMVSLSINAMDVLEHRLPDQETARQTVLKDKERPYMAMLLAYCVIGTVASLPLLLAAPISLMTQLSPGHSFWMNAGINGILLIAGLPLFIVTVLLTFAFQIIAFEKASLNPMAVLLKSIRMAIRRPITTSLLQLVLFLLTSILIPVPIVFLLRWAHLSQPIDMLHQWIFALVLEGTSPNQAGWQDVPMYTQLYESLTKEVPTLSASLTDSMLVSVILSLLLPLGTFAFTLLYRDLHSADPLKP